MCNLLWTSHCGCCNVLCWLEKNISWYIARVTRICRTGYATSEFRRTTAQSSLASRFDVILQFHLIWYYKESEIDTTQNFIVMLQFLHHSPLIYWHIFGVKEEILTNLIMLMFVFHTNKNSLIYRNPVLSTLTFNFKKNIQQCRKLRFWKSGSPLIGHHSPDSSPYLL